MKDSTVLKRMNCFDTAEEIKVEWNINQKKIYRLYFRENLEWEMQKIRYIFNTIKKKTNFSILNWSHKRKEKA